MKMKTFLCPEELALSYSKYYFLPLNAPHPAAAQILAEGSQNPEKALHIEDINDIFKPGYLPIEQGYSMLPNGSAVIANYVQMPGVTAEMIDWWFCWHWLAPLSVPEGNGNLRYKIWNPKEHWDTGGDEKTVARLLDETLSWRERRCPATSYIHESIDYGEVMMLEGWAIPPETMGVDLDLMNSTEYSTVLTACLPIGNPALGIHFYRHIPGGLELRTRYWFGYVIENGRPVRAPDSRPDERLIHDFTLHNMTEYPHLARFLPSLYAEESWKPLRAY
jgi:hypothetical protein